MREAARLYNLDRGKVGSDIQDACLLVAARQLSVPYLDF